MENVHISGNAKIFANAVTGGTPVIMEKASVYGELGGEIEVHEHAVILPGVVIDNPTIDVLHIRPDEIVVERNSNVSHLLLLLLPNINRTLVPLKSAAEGKNDRRHCNFLERKMPLNETKELAQIVDETILPMEHSGGDGWTILHGDTLQVIRAFKPQVFDAIITDPPYASGGWKPAEKNRTTNQKYSSMDKEKRPARF